MNLLILDKDGTIIKSASGETFIQNPQDQILIEGAAEALALWKKNGWQITLASNQGGVAAGHKSTASCIDEMFFAMQLCGIEYAMAAHSYEEKYGEALFFDLSEDDQQWRSITLTYSEQKFRKPHGGMIDFLARRIYGPSWRDDLEDDLEVRMIGDRPEDQQAAHHAGVKFSWASDWLKGGQP